MKTELKVIKALSDENRLRIVLMLNVRPLCVCEINSVLNIAVSTVSSHLKILTEAGIISYHKEGRWIVYTLTDGNDFINNQVGLLTDELKDNETVLEDRVKVEKTTRYQCGGQ